MTDLQKSLEIYQDQLHKGYIQIAYQTLTKYISELRKELTQEYSVSNLGTGYLDYSYFYFTDKYVKEKNLKYAVVINHKKLQVELWLCGRTNKIQKKYWEVFKNSKWNKDKIIPKYYVVSVPILEQLEFDKKTKMTAEILEKIKLSVGQLENWIERDN